MALISSRVMTIRRQGDDLIFDFDVYMFMMEAYKKWL